MKIFLMLRQAVCVGDIVLWRVNVSRILKITLDLHRHTSIVTSSNCSSYVNYDPDIISVGCITVKDILNYLNNIPPMHQNAEQKLEVGVNVKHSRTVFYSVFELWRKVKAENLYFIFIFVFGRSQFNV
jgi:hypothetical protein